MRDEDFRRIVRSAEAGDEDSHERLRRLSSEPDLAGLDDEAMWALRQIDEDALAAREGIWATIATRRRNRLAAIACCAALVAPLPSMGWRGVLEAGLCLVVGLLAGEALNQRVRDREAALRRRGA